MEPLEVIRREHRLILMMADVLECIAEQRRGLPEDWPEDLDRILTFFRVFVDLCHHGKEEEVLFPALGNNGVPEEDGPLGQALDQHEAFRAYLVGSSEALRGFRHHDPGALSRLRTNLSGLVDLCRQNIADEESRLLPTASQVFNRRELKMLETAFMALEAENLPPLMRSPFRRLIREVPLRYRQSTVRQGFPGRRILAPTG